MHFYNNSGNLVLQTSIIGVDLSPRLGDIAEGLGTVTGVPQRGPGADFVNIEVTFAFI